MARYTSAPSRRSSRRRLRSSERVVRNRGTFAAMPRISRPAIGLSVVGLGTIAAPLDTAVNIALPSITQAFGLQVQDIRWIVIAYVLTYASLMLVFGRIGDLL